MPDDATQIVELTPYRYRGYYYDAETRLYYLQSRYYDPELGRFLNADSLLDYTNGITSNLLCYCINNPVIYSDEKGYNPGTLFSSVAKAAKDFAELYYNISLYIRFELSSLIYIVYKKGKRYYSYTSYIIGDPHSCQPLDGLKKLPKKALLIGAIHTHPNSNFFSNADMRFAKKNYLALYLIAPNKSIYVYHDTRRGFKSEQVCKNLKLKSISKSLMKSLKNNYKKKWSNHIKKGCDFMCNKMRWPAW